MNPCKNCGARYVECGECGDDITIGIDHLIEDNKTSRAKIAALEAELAADATGIGGYQEIIRMLKADIELDDIALKEQQAELAEARAENLALHIVNAQLNTEVERLRAMLKTFGLCECCGDRLYLGDTWCANCRAAGRGEEIK